MILIIGGGWSGLACAVRLRQSCSHAITVIEAAPECGGRARGLQWEDRWIDNGQHLTVGAYRETFSLLRDVGAPDWECRPLRWSGLGLSRQIAQSWRVPHLGWPLRGLIASLPGLGPRGWPMQWRSSMRSALGELIGNRWSISERQDTAAPVPSVTEWLNRHQMPTDFVNHFWKPFTEGALNTEIGRAHAQILANVLRDTLAGPWKSCEVRTPPRNLSLDGVDPICDWLRRNRVEILNRQRALSLKPDASNGWRVHLSQGGAFQDKAAKAVILALPFDKSLSIWRASGLGQTLAATRWERLEHRAITTVWIGCGPAEEAALAGLPNWFVLNPQPGVPAIGQVAVKRKGVLGIVISAQSIDQSAEPESASASTKGLASGLCLQLRAQLGIDISILKQKWITEKTATWACTTDAPRPGAAEAAGATGMPQLYRCADDLEVDYPATIESAVRSGYRTADQVLRQLA